MKTKIILNNIPKKPSAARLQMVLERCYGNIIGTGQTEKCLGELIRDINQFCKVTGHWRERRAAIDFIRKQKEDHCAKQDFETAARFRDVQRILEGA